MAAGPGGETYSFQIQSNLIGIFQLEFWRSSGEKEVGLLGQQVKFLLQLFRITATQPVYRGVNMHSFTQVEVVVGRKKATQNKLVNLAFGLGLAFPLLIMGMEIDLAEIQKVIR